MKSSTIAVVARDLRNEVKVGREKVTGYSSLIIMLCFFYSREWRGYFGGFGLQTITSKVLTIQ